MEKDEAIEQVRKTWDENIRPINALKKQIRAEAEAKIEAEVAERRAKAALAINAALEAGVPKVAIREVTRKDHNGFEEYVTLGAKLGKKAGRKR